MKGVESEADWRRRDRAAVQKLRALEVFAALNISDGCFTLRLTKLTPNPLTSVCSLSLSSLLLCSSAVSSN